MRYKIIDTEVQHYIQDEPSYLTERELPPEEALAVFKEVFDKGVEAGYERGLDTIDPVEVADEWNSYKSEL